MVANLLGLVLMAGIVGLYLASKRQYVYDEQLARLQENGRYAISLLRRELLMAGFYGGLLSTEDIAAPPVVRDCSTRPWALDLSSSLGFADDHPALATIRLHEGT
jgi:Tfp pilus assembly protein PilW